jgi:hypothetical protein
MLIHLHRHLHPLLLGIHPDLFETFVCDGKTYYKHKDGKYYDTPENSVVQYPQQ